MRRTAAVAVAVVGVLAAGCNTGGGKTVHVTTRTTCAQWLKIGGDVRSNAMDRLMYAAGGSLFDTSGEAQFERAIDKACQAYPDDRVVSVAGEIAAIAKP